MADNGPPNTPLESLRYVNRPAMTGWQAVSKTVREVDEEKVRDSKEDIDTLLVFAGLFSAVLSAFLVESYQALSPDPDTRVVFLLERIANQSYTINSGFLNTTSPLQPPPPFEPPEWALRVNGLWFASLIVSLATASLGMLVKSWLREYLAGEWTSPQERLRARQYRNPALEKWKVFEIAAVLPLLLQVALGLFFVGLCFFTASIDQRMANTSLPIVVAWAFFFVLTTIAPLVSPRCPFKVLLLKGVLKSGRKHLIPQLYRAIGFAGSVFCLTSGPWRGLPSLREEEEDAIARAQDDAEILISMDAIMADDGLIATMWEALKQQSNPQPSEALAFALRLIRNRLGVKAGTVPLENLTTVPNLSSLSRSAYMAIMNVVAETLRLHSTLGLGALNRNSPEWMKDAVVMLVSQSPYTLPDDAMWTLRTCLDDKNAVCQAGETLGLRIRPDLDHGQVFSPLSARLLSVYEDVSSPHSPCLQSALKMYNVLLRGDAENQTSLLLTLHELPHLFENMLVRPLLDDMWPFLVENLRFEITSPKPKLRAGAMEGLMVILYYGEKLGRGQEAAKLYGEFWSSYKVCYTPFGRLASTDSYTRVPEDTMQTIFHDAFLSANPKARRQMLTNSTKVGHNFETDLYVNGKYTVHLDMVRFCLAHLRLYSAYLRSPIPTRKVEPEDGSSPASDLTPTDWEALWSQLAASLHKYWKTKGWRAAQEELSWHDTSRPRSTPDQILEQDREMAEASLNLMDSIDSTDCDTGVPSLFPDDLVVALGLFIRYPKIAQLPRLARLTPKSTVSSPSKSPRKKRKNAAHRGDEDSQLKDDEMGLSLLELDWSRASDPSSPDAVA